MKRSFSPLVLLAGFTLGSSSAWAAECLVPPTSAKAHSTQVTSTAAADAMPVRLNYDLFRRETARELKALPTGLEGRRQSALVDRTLGKPTFLWARNDAASVAVGALKGRELLIERARAQLRSEASLLGLTSAMIDEARVFDAQYNGDGPAVVRFRQQFQGLDVHHRSLNVLLDSAGRPVAVSGYFATDYDAALTAARPFTLSAAQAVAAGWASLGGAVEAAQMAVAFTRDGYDWFSVPELSGNWLFERLPRAKALYYPRKAGLEPAYYVELFANSRATRELAAYGLVVSAADGRILHRKDLVARATAFNYRVFADDASNNFHPYDSPLGNGFTPFPGSSSTDRVPRTTSATTRLVSVVATSGLTDPWLPDDATTTTGNNTDACIDAVDSPTSGLVTTPADVVTNTCLAAVGDIRPPATGANTFDYAVAPDEDPSNENARNAAVVNLFYINNWLHDWWYVHGFNEEAGNAQTDNYGRGGAEADPIRAQGQDASGRGNANMATPADGSSPTMQQYLFDGEVKGAVKVVAPAEGPSLLFSVGSFAPASFDLPATPVVLAADGVETETDGCGPAVEDPTGLGVVPGVPAPPQASLAGAIALVDRGTCSFTTKARFAQLSGAAALVVVNNSGGDPIPMGNADLPISLPLPVSTDDTYTIPAVMIRKADGDVIKALLAEGEEVQMTLQREPTTDLDGTLDNQIVAHEFFHYVHHRLTDSSNQQSGAMSEGWGDIDAFMLSTRPEDRLVAGNNLYQGAYSLAGYVVNGFYSGIRRTPYSTDLAKNGFTLKHLSDGEPTPDGGDGASNSAVHNGGEIWANQMWECYVGLLNDPRHSFAQAQNRMKDYIIGGLKMTPADATYTEARDAVLSVVLANDFQDYAVCSAGFAKRGNGLNAVAPARDSTDLVGVVEDFTPFVCGGLTPVVPEPPAPVGGSALDSTGRFGSGALNPGLLLALLGLGLLRRRRR